MKNDVNKRPEWDEFWFTQTLMYSTRGTCDRLRCACVLVKDKRLVGAGYNGSVAGQQHCDDVGHLIIDNHCERTLHAEENAILNTTDRLDVKGATAYVLATPCLRCTKILINAGVAEIKVLSKYANSRGKEHTEQMAKMAGVKMTEHAFDPAELIKNAVKRLEGPGGVMQKKD